MSIVTVFCSEVRYTSKVSLSPASNKFRILDKSKVVTISVPFAFNKISLTKTPAFLATPLDKLVTITPASIVFGNKGI